MRRTNDDAGVVRRAEAGLGCVLEFNLSLQFDKNDLATQGEKTLRWNIPIPGSCRATLPLPFPGSLLAPRRDPPHPLRLSSQARHAL